MELLGKSKINLQEEFLLGKVNLCFIKLFNKLDYLHLWRVISFTKKKKKRHRLGGLNSRNLFSYISGRLEVQDQGLC